MNNMQKAFKRKAGLQAAQKLADGGHPDPRILGTGMARGAGEALKGRAAQLARMEAEAMGEAPPQPAPQEPRRKGLADGGRASPELLGWGLARGAGQALQSRGAQLAAAENEALGGAPAPAAPVAPTGAGGMSGIRDGAMPPASMLLAQRRGLADGGMPAGDPEQGFFETDSRYTARRGKEVGAYLANANSTLRGHHYGPPDVGDGGGGSAAVPGAPVDPRKVDVMGRPYDPNTPQFGYRGYDPSRQNMYEKQQADAFTASRRGLADGGLKRGNAARIETGDGGPVRGPGGPTEDKVGPVALSDKEYVLPADTVEAMGGAETLDQIRDATHEFVNEKSRPRGLADGGQGGLVGPADPGWFARQHAVARTQQRADAAVKAGTADADQQKMHDQNLQKLLDDPAVMNPLSELPGVGLASRGASAVEAAAPGIISGLRAGANKAASYVTSKLGIPAISKAAPGAVSQGITNAERVAATPNGYVTGGLAQPAASAAETLTAGALPTAPRIGANLLATQTLDADGSAGRPSAAPTASVPGAAGAGAGAGGPVDDRVTYDQAQGLSRGAPQAGKTYRLGGGQYSDSNADIFAGSTRADGTLNNFSGTGDGKRPNWEQRNPQDYQAALQRAANDKASVISLAVSHINEGTTDGLDRAYQLAAGDPEATAAVEAARQQYGLRKAAMSGNKEAGAILRQQDAGQASRDTAEITAGATERVGLAKARADMAKAGQEQRNADRTYNLSVRTADRADGVANRTKFDRVIEDRFGKRFDKDGVVNPEYADFSRRLQETMLGVPTAAGQAPLTLDNLSERDAQRLLRAYDDSKTLEPGAFEKFVLKYWKGKPYTASDDLTRSAPNAKTYDKGLVNDTVEDGSGTPLAIPRGDLTYEQKKRMGMI